MTEIGGGVSSAGTNSSGVLTVSLKRKAVSSSESDYSPACGRVSFQTFQRAVEAFDVSKEKRFLLATDVNLKAWLVSGINERMGNVFVEAIFKNGDVFSDSTVGDLWIVKVQNKPHELVVNEITALIAPYRTLHGRLFDIGGGNMILPGCIRRADTGISPNHDPAILNGQSGMHRVLFEVEFGHRSVSQAHRFVSEYFPLIPVLQAVVLFVFWGRRTNGSFAAIAILYRRNGVGGNVQDAVSFGSADIFPSAFVRIPACIRDLPIRNLPKAPIGASPLSPCPWTPAHQPYIRVPGADVFHLGPAGALLPGAPVPPPDMDISLWEIVTTLCNRDF